MRIGLDFRFLAFGRQGLVRGIPRFSQEQLQSVLALDRDSTYLLLCDAGVDAEAIRAEIRRAPNAHVVCAPEEMKTVVAGMDDAGTMLAQFSAYQRWLDGLRLDLFHATCPAWLNGILMPGFDVCPYVATAYDLIPLLYPAHYLPKRAEWETYEQRLLFLGQATRIAAISHATAMDIVEHLGVPPERIDITLPAPASCFRPLPPDVSRSMLRSLDHPTRRVTRRRVQIPAHYVLAVTDLHYSKNITTLLPAYADLPRSVRKRFPLVVAGHLGTGEVEALEWMTGQLDISGDVIVAGRVSDEELTALYNAATVMVHASHHEGFGLPVVEAMRCGAPVITTTRSALPEIAGDAALLVDSDDPAAFTQAIDLLIHDGERRDDLRRRGFEQAARYTSGQLARATLQCYNTALASPVRDASDAIRVALWSPIPPQAAAISYYTDDLVAALTAEPGLELDIFVDDKVMPPLSILREARVHHGSDFDRTARCRPFDVIIYQIGASPLQAYMEQAMLSYPGIVVLHDLRWSHALLGDRLSLVDGEQRFRAELDALEGEGAAREWDRLLALPSRGRREEERRFLDDHPMLGPVVDTAKCCVAVTPALRSELLRRYPQADAARVIPVGVRDPEQAGYGRDRAAARAYLDMERDAFIVVVPMRDDSVPYLNTAVEAFAGLKRAGVDALLAIVGSLDAASTASLHAHGERLGIGDSVRVPGHVSRVTFDAYLAACDAVVLQGDLGVGEIPDAMIRAFAVGRCVIISDSAASRLLPDSACIRVASAPHGPSGISTALMELHRHGTRRAALERAARAHFEHTARIEPMVEGYLTVIQERAGRPPSQHTTADTQPVKMTGRWGRPAPPTRPLGYSKVCELEDFAHPQLLDVIRDVCGHKRRAFGEDFPIGFEYRKDWEVSMAVRALADHGALRPDARVLGVAAGTEDTVFYLTRHVGEVVAIDRYREPGQWEETAPPTMLVDPGRLAPFTFRAERLTVQHMDARILDYPDESFDGIFSSGSIEHFGDLQTIAAAAYEMGRVLKPGGILTLSTELLLTRDASGEGASFPGTMLLSPSELQRYIVDASGLEAIDDLDLSVSHWTLGTSRDMATAVGSRSARHAAQPDGDRVPEWACWDMPHIVIEWGGKRFTSVHLALRRAPVHPVVDNSWARPSPELRAAVAEASADATHDDADITAPAPALVHEIRSLTTKCTAAEERLAALLVTVDTAGADISAGLQEAALPRAGVYWASHPPASASEPSDAPSTAPPAPGTVACPIVSPLTPPYTVVVSEDADDIISAEFLAGRGVGVNTNLTSLVLALVPAEGVFVDLGANVGSISLPLAAAGRRVLSVEAVPLNAALLEMSAMVSGVSDRMQVIATAVGDRVGEASFMLHGCHGQLIDSDVDGAVRVPLTTVDALIESERLERIDLVKIDVEGAELDVLRGMARLARRADAPYLLVECCPHTLVAYGQTTAELISLLEDYGYAVYNVDSYNVKTKRLMRRRPDEVQVTTVMDVLAAKQGVHRVPGWRVEPAISRSELVERFITESRSRNSDCRASAARVAQELHPEILKVPAVAATLERLSSDPEPTVRAAAAWWRQPQGVAGART